VASTVGRPAPPHRTLTHLCDGTGAGTGHTGRARGIQR
jgi:hypothetical protein